MVQVQDLTFVVRSAGERTRDAALRVLASQITALGGDPSAQITNVEAKPFVNAVRATYEIGLASGRPWVVGMDADVLLLSDGVGRLMRLCDAAAPDAFTLTTLVLCKFFGGFCFRGIHLYPRRLLAEALPLIEESKAAESLRPETAVVQAMVARGYRLEGPPEPVGVHDFEQSFRQIYLKMLLRGRREMSDDGGRGYGAYLAFLQDLAKRDADGLVASWGLADGASDASRADAPAHYPWDAEYPRLDERLRAFRIREKPALQAHAAAEIADAIIAAHPFATDIRTPAWIRERFAFASGTSAVLAAWRIPGSERAGLRAA